MKIKQGFYIGKGNEYEETHGGIKMISQKYFILFFNKLEIYKKGIWIYLDKPINIGDYISEFKTEIKQNGTNFLRGSYSIDGNILEISLVSNSQNYKEVYSILSPEVLLDDNVKEYKYLEMPQLS